MRKAIPLLAIGLFLLLIIAPAFAFTFGSPYVVEYYPKTFYLLDYSKGYYFNNYATGTDEMGFGGVYQHDRLNGLRPNVDYTAQYFDISPGPNASTNNTYDHITGHIHVAEGSQGSLNGTITLSDGSTVPFFFTGYNDNSIMLASNYRTSWGINYNGVTAQTQKLSALWFGNPNGIIIDLVREKSTGNINLGIVACYEENIAEGQPLQDHYYWPNAVMLNLTKGTYIKAIQFTSSCNIKAEFYYTDIYTLGKTVSTSRGAPTDDPHKGDLTNALLDILASVPGYIVSLLTFVLMLLGFILWVIYPTHLLLIIVSAESLMVLMALTSSRDVFTAISKFARYNSEAFYALQGLAGATITVLSEAAVFAYNVFQMVNPLRWIFG